MGRAQTQIGRALPGLAALVASLLVALSTPPPAPAAGPVVAAATGDAAVRSYWTPERMRAAEPVDPPAPDTAESGEPGGGEPDGPATAVAPVAPGSAAVERLAPGEVGSEPTTRAARLDRDEIEDPAAEPYRSHGKVFFSVGGDDFVCSGTAISSPGRSVVWTAGHCVYDEFERRFVSNWMFVPGYHNGASPYGEWPAERLATTKQYRTTFNLKFDLGAAVVHEGAGERNLTDVVGGRGIGFHQSREQRYESFGYPSQPPPLAFTGGREFRCSSELGGNDNPQPADPRQSWPGPNTIWIPCDMTGGSSGGGMVAEGSVLSVNSYSYCDITGLLCDGRMHGPYQEDAAEALYLSVAGETERCGGRAVTHLGTGRADRIVGTRGRDVIKGLGGGDVIAGRGDRDIICAGGGDDRVRGGRGRDALKGQRGDDRLRGNRGRDKLRGGPGPDFCDGGPGRDKARGCERVRRAS